MADIKPKMSKHAAEVLIESARLDLKMKDLSDDVLAELVKRFGYIPYKARVQVIVGSRNDKAAEAFWDKKYDVAVYWLRALGFTKTINVKRPPPPIDVFPPRLTGTSFNAKHDWKYVK